MKHLWLGVIAGCVLTVASAKPVRAAGPTHPFGSRLQRYAAGALRPEMSQVRLDAETATAYRRWAARYLEPGCAPGELRVRSRSDTAAEDVSEGQGYGMVVTVLMAGSDPAAQQRFDGLTRFLVAHPSRPDAALMAWAQDLRCRDVGGGDSATDGDLDAAFALFLADAQWGSQGAIDYRTLALRMLGSIWARDINPATLLTGLGDGTRPGDPLHWWGSRPSDWMLDHFAVFAGATRDARWTRSVMLTYG